MSILRAAWVPDDDPERDWEVGTELAVRWVEHEAAEQDATAVLVLNAFGAEQSIPTLRRFAERHLVTTPRSGKQRAGSGVGPVLAYVPDAKTLEFATGLARSSSLAVVEGANLFPLHGWAAQVHAIDLTRPENEVEEVDARLTSALERLRFYGNNGYGPPFDRQQVARVLDDLRSAGLLDHDVVIGALAAQGLSPHGLKRLGQLIKAAGGR
ncbi:hypothetical protein ABZV92_26310 [Streptomyces rubiginosohelvolus]|uniref:hypothetical protein n=1 Tax=Streptomyces rubiginosohelvolus TaxID=67362 RepID=UPI0033A64169